MNALIIGGSGGSNDHDVTSMMGEMIINNIAYRNGL